MQIATQVITRNDRLLVSHGSQMVSYENVQVT